MVKKSVTVAAYIKQQLALTDKSQKQIATEVGFNQPNNVSMIKEGISKLPINRVPAFAKALGVDSVHLLRLTMKEYMPETWNVIESMLGQSLITENERHLLEMVRKHTRGLDVDFHSPKLEKALTTALENYVEAEIKDRDSAARAAAGSGRRPARA